jgi:UDP-N-acetylglucosamine 2-epimerase (non-hydrolysing)
MKFLFVFGTRPEAIKLCPLILKMREHNSVSVCVTGQHQEMLSPFLTMFGITPDFNLQLLQPNQTLSGLTARCIDALSVVYHEAKPDCVIVQGDTTSSMCAALSAFYQKIPVAHVEAGLRTYQPHSPFPEEMNRQITTRIAQYHFVPTEKNKQNLINEGCDSRNIFLTGNTGIDALQWVLKNKPIEFKEYENKKIILVTGHRRENFGKPFEQFCLGIKKVAKAFPDYLIIYPVHLNPHVQKPVYEILSDIENIRLISPQDYPEFTTLMSKASLIITDSGGVQEEAPTFRIPILVTRDTTERQEAVESGFAFLVGTDSEKIVEYAIRCLKEKDFYQPVGENPYGDGSAVDKISAVLALKCRATQEIF